MIALSGVLSFGAEEKYELVRKLTPVHVCLIDLNRSASPIQDIATVTDFLFNLRTETIDGVPVDAAQVGWVNVPDKDHNPCGETGYLLTKVYAHKLPTTEP